MIPPRVRNIAMAALLPVIIVFFAFRVAAPPAERRPSVTTVEDMPNEGAEATPSEPERSRATGFSYALDLASIDGLPPDLTEGTPVEVWVTWSRGGRVAEPEKWIGVATFERIAPAVTPSGPDAVVLTIPADQKAKMIWAAQYGAVSIFAAQG
jgi:hypothetical protein